MMSIACYVLLFCLHFVHSKAGLGVGVCGRDPLRCCVNYRQEYTFCNPCDEGTYGHNCSGGRCVYGSYGFGCLKKCNCSRDQFCDASIGCSYNISGETKASAGIWMVNVSIMVVSFGGAVLLVAIAVILVKRQRVMNATTHGFYLGESMPIADTTSESYMRVEENIYNEPELISLDYIDPFDDSDKNNYISKRQERPREEREDRTKQKSTVLSLLMRDRKESEFDKVDRGYIDIMEINSGTDSLPASPPLTTLTTTATTSTMTVSTLPLQTTSQLTTKPLPRFPPVEKRKFQLTTAFPKELHQSVARETNTTTQPTVAKAYTSTSPLESGIDTQSSRSLGVKVTEQPSSPFTITTEIITKSETTKLSSVALIKLPSDTLSEPTKTTDPTTLNIPRTRKNVKTKTFLQSQPTTTGQPTTTAVTTRQTNSKTIQHMIDFYETAQSKI
ncbi:uncharacterized protein LOC125679329 [Ostrea edulis]|uniref:uncharacterized protein LOC125679329 n=1 Tax=Ostrea edulis TaxID=37623 RepID=UPI0024AFC2AC|nr:uncharacterized protein LOC125679329 [Ostrea edulis]